MVLSIIERTVLLTNKDGMGNTTMDFPITKVENVEGLESQLGLPVGFMYFSLEKTVPVGRLPAQGATYNRTLYADLWAYAQERGLVVSESEWQAIASANDGNCAYYSSGDGSSTFRVPSIKCWVKGANSAGEVGSYLEAGLPNITGKDPLSWSGMTNGVLNNGGSQEGALTGEKVTGYGFKTLAGNVATINETLGYGVGLDASLSNPIYGNSDTVQPSSLVGQWLIVAFGVAHNIGEADVADVMQAVEQVQTGVEQVQTGLGEVQQHLKPYVPDYSAEIYTCPFSKDINASNWFTAPYAGVLYVTWSANPQSAIVYYFINDCPQRIVVYNGATQINGFTTFILNKGDRIKFYLTGNEKSGEQNGYFYPFKEATV